MLLHKWQWALLFVSVAVLVAAITYLAMHHAYADQGIMMNAKAPQAYLTQEGIEEQERQLWAMAYRKRLYSTFYDKEAIPQEVYNRFDAFAPEFDFIIHDDEDALEWLERWYTPVVVKAFRKLSGAHKADLIRFAWLYVMGGMYLDIKTIPITALNNLLPQDPDAVLAVKSNVSPAHIGILYGKPKHPIFGRMIDIIVRTNPSRVKVDYIYFCRGFRNVASLEGSVKWLNEECHHHNCSMVGKDRYGMCCVIKDRLGAVVMHTRDPTYPYKRKQPTTPPYADGS